MSITQRGEAKTQKLYDTEMEWYINEKTFLNMGEFISMYEFSDFTI